MTLFRDDKENEGNETIKQTRNGATKVPVNNNDIKMKRINC